MHRSLSTPASLCLVLLLLALGPVYGKNILSQLGELMSDNSGNKAIVDDAATGTVQDLESKQAASCDGQLAVALVQANDLAAVARKEKDEAQAKHGEALATIAGLERDLAHTKSSLEKDVAELTKIRDASEEVLREEKDRAANELEETKARAREEYEALRGEMNASLAALREEKDAAFEAMRNEKDAAFEAMRNEFDAAFEALRTQKDATIEELTEESANAMETLRETAHNEYQSLKTEKDNEIAGLEAKLLMSSEELQATMRLELEKAKLDKENKVAAITADRDETVAELTGRMEHAIREAAQVLQSTKEEAENTIARLEEERDENIAKMTAEMQDAEQHFTRVLEETRDEAQALLAKKMGEKTAELEQTKRENDERLSEKNQKILKLKEYTEQMLDKKAAIERSMEEATAEITHWRALHAERSYCNMTHVSTDLYDGGLAVYAMAVEQAGVVGDIAMVHVSKGLEKSKDFVHGQVEEYWQAIEPHYQEHVASQYQTHLEPHLHKHVFPKLHQASVWFQTTVMPLVMEGIGIVKEIYHTKVVPIVEAKYQGLVDSYGYYCKSYLRDFEKVSQESQVLKDNPPPAYLLESWQISCANPRESLGALINGTLTLFALVFYRRLLGVVCWMGAFSLSLVLLPLRWTPLGWFLPRRSAAAGELACDAGDPVELAPAAEEVEVGSPSAGSEVESEGNGGEVVAEEDSEDNDEDEDKSTSGKTDCGDETNGPVAATLY